ncbi:hypothetical protein EDB85DRAFT_2030496 [Lactarius pseudohatsudake]|nr:hypothetical protein EDB85DRAFT_2030496 [Lactarius pseudohatsudake]
MWRRMAPLDTTARLFWVSVGVRVLQQSSSVASHNKTIVGCSDVTFSAADVANPPQVGRKCGDRSGPDIQYAWYDGSCNEIQKDMRLSNRNAQFIGPILWPL